MPHPTPLKACLTYFGPSGHSAVHGETVVETETGTPEEVFEEMSRRRFLRSLPGLVVGTPNSGYRILLEVGPSRVQFMLPDPT